MTVRRAVLPLTAVLAALTATTAPPALAEPAENRPYSQFVPFADLDPANPPRTDYAMPVAIDVTKDGTIHVASLETLYAVDADGRVATVPGTWYTQDENIMEQPVAVTTGPDGTVYVLTPESVRRVTPDGTGALVAGGGEKNEKYHRAGENGGDGGPATEAGLWDVKDIAADAAGNLYVADPYNDRVRRIDPAGVITTFAGGGDTDDRKADGVPATAIDLAEPIGVDVDAEGNVYVLDALSIRKITPAGVISTLIGKAGCGFAGDGGPATKGRMGCESRATIQSWGGGGLDVDATGAVYFADRENGFVRRIDAKGTLTTLGPLIGDDVGVGRNGDVYQGVEDEITVLRKETRAGGKPVAAGPEPHWTNREPGTVVSVEDEARDVPAEVQGIHVLPSGALALGLEDDLRQLDPDGTTKPVKGFRAPARDPLGVEDALAFGQDGSMYVQTPKAEIERLFPDGAWQPLVGDWHGEDEFRPGVPAMSQHLNVFSAAVTTRGDLYFTADKALYRIDEDGALTRAATFRADVRNLTAGPDGTLYLVEETRVLRVDEQHQVSTVAGDGSVGSYAGEGGPAVDAHLSYPSSLAVSPNGYVYIGTDGGVRRVDPDGNIATLPTVADQLTGYEEPGALAVDQHGNLYFTNDGAHLMVVAHADEVVLPLSFRWSALGLGALVTAALGAAGWGILRYRKDNAGLLRSAR